MAIARIFDESCGPDSMATIRDSVIHRLRPGPKKSYGDEQVDA